MDQQIEDLKRQFEAIQKDAAELTAGLTHEQWLWRPQPGAWSIAECLAHLASLDGQDLPNIFRSVTLARKEGPKGTGPFRWGLLERLFIAHVEPPAKLKVKAPKQYRPAPELDPAEVWLEYQRIQNDIRFLVGESDGLHLSQVKVRLAALPRLKMSLGARLSLLAAHNRRHLWQARRVRESVNFPKNS